MPDLGERIFPILDRRLAPISAGPLAVALSGGGDSLALLRLTLDWARRHGRRVMALTVDHRLNPASADWTAWAVSRARALGAQAQALSWEGEKPQTGLPAAARLARHRLLADAAREAGAGVILLGHTADDLAETALMREAGATTPSPREWSPSPVWPQGRGLFLLRPLLAAGRAELRDWLTAQGETWLDDPANDDLRFARARARRALAGHAQAAAPPDPPPLDVQVVADATGTLTLPRDAPAEAVAAACLCAAGTDRPPRGERLARLVERLRHADPFAATLAGARVEADGDRALFAREAGRGVSSFALTPGQPAVWDGRFEMRTERADLAVRALGGLTARLPAAERTALRRIPAAVRLALPALVDAAGGVSCPILAVQQGTTVDALAAARFAAACGLVTREAMRL